MIVRSMATWVLLVFSTGAWAVAPYIQGDALPAGTVQAVASAVEAKLKNAGFKVVGKYFPKDLAGHGVVVATDDDMLRAVGASGGYAVLGAATGEAVTSGLRVRGELVSADFGMDSDDAHYSILCASKLDDYRAYSPGLQSLFAIIRRSHEQGLKRFDFGIGKTRQKSDFGSTEIPLFNLTVARSVKGRAVSLVYDRAKPVKTLLRRLTGKIR